MIDAEGVIYDYPSGRALHGVSFVVRAGAVLALVGPNGAGKSTLLRCIAALDAPTEGHVSVLGLDTRRHPREVHAGLGYLPDQFGLYDALSVNQCLVYAARAHGVPIARADAAAVSAARRVGLTDRMTQLAGTLSRGLRQRLAIGQTIVHEPRVLLLDEPASGLDPEARASLSDLIRGLAQQGMTIVVSSHILAELEDYCTEMLMLRDGRVVGDGVIKVEPSAGAPSHTDDELSIRVEVLFSQAYPDLQDRISALGLTLERTPLERDVGRERAVFRLGPGMREDEVLVRLVGSGLRVRAFNRLRSGLEDVYMAAARAETTAVPEAGA